MPSYNSPDRQRLGNSRPCWQGALCALPTLDLEPSASVPDYITARIIVDGGWYHFTCSRAALPWLWAQWESDPERAAVELFGAKLPQGTRWQAPSQEPTSPEDLGL